MNFENIKNLDVVQIATLLHDDHLEYSLDEEPKLMDSMGQLVDKLSIVNNKMWANQELVYAIRRMSTEEFINHWKDNLPGLHTILKRCADLNVQRVRLVDEFDKRLVSALKGEIKPDELSAPQHKTY